MAKLIPASERILRARKLIEQARALPVPTEGLGKSDFSYIASVRDLMRQAWWIMTFPGLAIAITVLGFNLLGDGLRDILDPRSRQR